MTDTEKKIEVIRWACANGYAEGFELDLRLGKDVLICPDQSWVYITGNINPSDSPWLPHFYTRTIEGILDHKLYDIDFFKMYIPETKWKMMLNDIDTGVTHHYVMGNTPDQAKLSAIIYVMEHSEEKV